jgi:excisionase family DNA binding protein
MNNSLLTIEEMGKYLRISRSKAYQLAKKQGFPSFILGRLIRVDKSQLDAWLNNSNKNGIIS